MTASPPIPLQDYETMRRRQMIRRLARQACDLERRYQAAPPQVQTSQAGRSVHALYLRLVGATHD